MADKCSEAGAVSQALASFWRSNPWLTPAVIAPLIVSHRSLSILALLRDSEDRFRAMFDSAAIGTRPLLPNDVAGS